MTTDSAASTDADTAADTAAATAAVPTDRVAAARSRVTRTRAAIVAARAEIAIVAGITLLAAVIRLWDIGTVPLGLHGDEAWTGLDARRINADGWIGPYVFSALGQPTGPLYFTALLFRVLPETTATIRLSMAFWGVLTIPVTYLAFRAMFGRTTATFAALLLAIMTWHLHLSRTGFMVTTWPFMQMLTLLLFWLALQRRSIWLYATAGLAAGLGVYTYNAYLLFLPVLAVPSIWTFAGAPDRGARKRILAGTAIACAAGLIAAWPLICWARDNSYVYHYHRKIVGVTHSDAWEDGSWLDRADILWDRGAEWGRGLAIGDRADLGDGLATTGHPVVDPVTLSLAAGGALIALRRIRRAEYATVLAVFPIMIWGALLTVLDGLFRRTFGMAPFIALLAALPLAWLWTNMRARGDNIGSAALGVIAGGLVILGAINVRAYFGPVQDTVAIRFTHPYQLHQASQYLDTMPRDTYVYFYSDRWRFTYETRSFLAPGFTDFQDRSTEFRFHASPEAPLDFGADRSRRTVFLLLGTYIDELGTVEAMHPGGVAAEGRRGDEVTFRAYVLEPIEGEEPPPAIEAP